MGLHIVVHAQNVIALGVVEGGHQGVMLAEVAHQVDAADIVVLCGQCPNFVKGAVGGAVIDQDELTLVARIFFKFRYCQLHHLANGLFGVIAGDHNGNQHVSFSVPSFARKS